MVAFTLRYNRIRLIVWLLLTVGMVAFIGSYYKGLDPQALQELIIAGRVPSMQSLLGWITAAAPGSAPLGAAVWIKSWMFVSLMLGIGMVFLVTHNLRADEDTGRTELFRSRPLGLHSSLASTLIMTVGLCLIAAIGIGAVGVAQQYGATLGSTSGGDPDPLGSWVFGASIGAVGLIGIGVGVLTNELMSTSGGANGLGAAILGLFYIVRMGTDIQNGDLTWISPIGWAEKMDPWSHNLMWPLAAIIALTAVLIGVGWMIEARRDYGGSLFAARPGHASARRWMTSVTGLAVRLQRTAWIGWAVGIAVFALMLGSITPMMADMFKSADIGGVDASSMLAVIGFLLSMISLGVCSFAVYSTSTMALDDAHGLLEHQLSGAVSRVGWALKRLAVSFVGTLILLIILCKVYALSYGAGMNDFGDFWTITALAFAFVPSMLVLMGVVVLGFGWWPRQAVAIGWALFGALWFIMILGQVLKLPEDVLNAMPFFSAATTLANGPDWATLIVTAIVGLAMIVIGLIGFRRRNVPA
jgi:ABC-2 type transport system permease protein